MFCVCLVSWRCFFFFKKLVPIKTKYTVKVCQLQLVPDRSGDGYFLKCCARLYLDKNNTCFVPQSPSSDHLILTHKWSFVNDFDRRENIGIHHISHMLCASTHDRKSKNMDFSWKRCFKATLMAQCVLCYHIYSRLSFQLRLRMNLRWDQVKHVANPHL